LPEVGDKVSAGKTVAAVESVKAAADVYSPVSGEIIEINSKLAGERMIINMLPFKTSFLFRAPCAVFRRANLDETGLADILTSVQTHLTSSTRARCRTDGLPR
jgi:glycine cleavage system H lipoate-binding protein